MYKLDQEVELTHFQRIMTFNCRRYQKKFLFVFMLERTKFNRFGYSFETHSDPPKENWMNQRMTN